MINFLSTITPAAMIVLSLLNFAVQLYSKNYWPSFYWLASASILLSVYQMSRG